MVLNLLKKALLAVATVYALMFIVAIWMEELTSKFFWKLSVTIFVIEALLALYYYFVYWNSDEKQNDKDYFAD